MAKERGRYPIYRLGPAKSRILWGLYIMGRDEKETTRFKGNMAGLEWNLQEIVDGLADELLVIDDEYRIQFANAAARRHCQEDVFLPVARRCYQLFQGRDKPCGGPLWDCPLRKVIKTGQTVLLTHRDQITASGGERYLTVSAAPLKDNQGNIRAIVELRRDVTAERELESQILRRYRELSALNRISGAISGPLDLDAILNVGLDAVLDIVDGTTGGILLLEEETQMLCYRVHRNLSGKYVREMCLRMGEGIAGEVAQSGVPILTEDISLDPRAAHPDLITTEGLKAFASVPLRSKDKVLGVINVASRQQRQFTEADLELLSSIGDQLGVAVERAKLYEQVKQASQTYQKLLQQTILAQEEERRRIARELHDETSQTITGLTFNLQAVLDSLSLSHTESGGIKDNLKNIQALAIQATTEIGKLINDLRPSLLDQLGLEAAVRRYAEVHLQPQGINLSIGCDLANRRLPPEVEVALFRIAQGAISNVMKHAQAKNVAIRLSRSRGEACFSIRDDGRGFDPSNLSNPGRMGVGILTMRERVNLLGGTCTVQSQPGYGTMISVKVPIPEGSSGAEDKGANSR